MKNKFYQHSLPYIFVWWAMLLISNALQAQINESDTLLFQLRGGLTGNFQQGNVEFLAVRGRLEFSVAPNKAIVFKSQNSSMYQEFFGRKADNDIFSRNYLYFRPQQRQYAFLIGYVNTNFRRKIDWRYFAGAGLTYRLVRQKGHSLKAAFGAIHEQTRFRATDFNINRYDGSADIRLWRGNFWMEGSHLLGKKHLRLYYDAFYQPAFNERANYRWQTDLGLDILVWKGLNINVLYTLAFENVVANAIKNTDRVLTFGLAYQIKH
jgi:Protein of unknown function, DUF481